MTTRILRARPDTASGIDLAWEQALASDAALAAYLRLLAELCAAAALRRSSYRARAEAR
jgi:hypothetical protein